MIRPCASQLVALVAFTVTASQSSAVVGEEVTRLVADDAWSDARFGMSVALYGGVALIGADGDTAAKGAAYIFEHDGHGHWSQAAKLTADDALHGDVFGRAVSLWGTTAIVTAVGEGDDDSHHYSPNIGSAYVFKNSGGANWTQVAKLRPNDGQADRGFGGAVSLHDTTAVIGAAGDNHAGYLSGSALVFQENSAGDWTQVAKLVASDATDNDLFGHSVSVYGDRALVGAPRANGIRSTTGAAYLYQDNGAGVWTQIGKLTASDGRFLDEFGQSVSLFGNTALVGASGNDGLGGDDAGSAYLFRDDGSGNWQQIARLTPNDAATHNAAWNDFFGWSVSLWGNSAVVGANGNNHGDMNDAGAAYLFHEDESGVWRQTSKLAAHDRNAYDWGGWSVAATSTHALMGAYLDDDAGESSGSAYIFQTRVPEPAALQIAILGLSALIALARREYGST